MRAVIGLLCAAYVASGCAAPQSNARAFELARDSFTFSNELRWEYEFTDSGGVSTRKNEPAPEYSLRCFPMVRAAREFFYHAEFRPNLARAGEKEYRELIRKVIERSSRSPAPAGKRIVIPGFASLHEFSSEYGRLLKAQCGGAFLSFFQRGNWRMVFPLTAGGRSKTVERFMRKLSAGELPIAHVYRFPNTTLNHALLIYGAHEEPSGITFSAYDPNDPTRPARLRFERETSRFIFERNRYFGGGEVRVYEVYRGAFY